MPLTPSLDTAGPLAVSAEDCRVVFQALVGFDADDDWSRPAKDAEDTPLHGARVGVLGGFSAMAHPDVRSGVDDTARAFDGLGAVVEEIDGPDPDEAWAAVGPIFVTEFAACFPHLKDDNRADPEVRSLLEAGASIPGTVYANSVRAAHRFSRDVASLFERYDALLAPTAAYVAPRAKDQEIDVGGRAIDVHSGGPARLTMPFNLAGVPALAFPVGSSPGGLPLSAQLIGPEWSELRLCSMVSAYQQATDWHLRSPVE
jgi:aspartyl-tRNA(Asn)/glutamyl-tRNA(Gln) amidotransferase subunit A